MPLVVAAVAVACLLVVGVVVGVVVSRGGSDDPAPAAAGGSAADVTSLDQIRGVASSGYAAGQQHVTTSVSYRESPPVGGPHDPEWADCTGTVYDVDIRHENAVHSLEHGAVWITYDPDAIHSGDLAVLEKLVTGTTGLMLSPYQGLSSPISLQSWNHQLFVDRATDQRVRQFANFLAFNDTVPGAYPEVGASCENPSFAQDPLLVGDPSRARSSGVTDAPAGAPTSAAGESAECSFTPSSGTSGADVGTPPSAVSATGTVTLAMATGFGDIGLTLDRQGAPCAVASFEHLTQHRFFDGTRCHRETNVDGLKVLQCGDPTGTGTGAGPYSFPTEVHGDEVYDRGTVAMANAGTGFDGSQFFLVFGDSQLPPEYTVVGTVDRAGLAVLDGIAKLGNDGSNGTGDGRPVQPVLISSMSVAG